MIMLHIFIAVSGLLTSLLGLAFAYRMLVRASYVQFASTVAKGSVLIVMDPSAMLHVCVSGLVYVAIATGLTQMARGRVRSMREANSK